MQTASNFRPALQLFPDLPPGRPPRPHPGTRAPLGIRTTDRDAPSPKSGRRPAA